MYNYGRNRFWNGQIDELGIWNRVLNDIEIQELYNNGYGLEYPFNNPNNNPPLVSLGPDISSCKGDTVILDANNPGCSYLWSTGDTTQTTKVTTTDIYSVVVSNNAGSSADSIGVYFTPLPEVYAGEDALCLETFYNLMGQLQTSIHCCGQHR